MALGRCPVIIADHFIPPAGPQWSEFALFYPQNKSFLNLQSFLEKHESHYKELGAKARANWDQFFAGDQMSRFYANALISLIRSTSACTKESEVKRWRSFSTYWNNRWTVPQGAYNKYKKLLKGVD
jgi:hypothetical protein